MINNVILKFCKPDNTEFIVQRDTDWRFLKNGLINFSNVDSQVIFADSVMSDGGDVQRIRLGRADRTVKLAYINRFNNAEARHQFTNFFIPRTTYKIYATYMGVTRWAEGTLYKLQLSEKLEDTLIMTATMTFVFANPYWKSIDNFGKDIAETIPMTAFPYLCPINGTNPTGIFLFDKTVHLYNDGHIPIYPEVIIRSSDACVNPVFRINDSQIKINDSMSAGDEIRINLGATPPRIEKNGVNYFGHVDKQSQLTTCYLSIGDNLVSFDADDGANYISVTIYYNKMYTVV